ncbi:MAG: pitrilysin family protein [Candidatus Eiseniibacteriota bacterium]|jgi:predicted Zn-dependent peptidase
MLDLAHVSRRRLSNGLTFLADTEVENDIVALKLHFHLGSLYEDDAEAGLGSCVARMLLMGAADRQAADLALDLESLGVRLHTGVGNENGIVSLVCPRDVFEAGFEIMLDILTAPTFPEHELERDRQRTIGKIRARLDHPFSHAVDLFDETFYRDHPYHKPAIGYEAAVAGFTRAQLVDCWERALRPEHMVAALVGRVSTAQVVAGLERRLVKRDNGHHTPRPGRQPGAEPAERLETRRTQTAWIVIGWPAPPVGHDDAAAMTLLTSILGGSMDSRLFTELRDKRGLAYEVGAQYRGYAGPSCTITYMGTGGEQFAAGRQGMLDEVERLRDEGPTAAEVERGRSYLDGSYRMAMERNSQRASTYGVHELFGLGYDHAVRFLERLERLEADTLREVAVRWWRGPTSAAVVPEQNGEKPGSTGSP